MVNKAYCCDPLRMEMLMKQVKFITFLFLAIAILAVPAAPVSASMAAANATPTPAPQSGTAGGINPLTGLPVDDPSLLALPPALISISNFPVSARPQAGLSTTPLVFEIFIGEGMTRYLALFYGEFAKGHKTAAQEASSAIGPIRSGRLPYEELRELYDGFLVMSGAYIKVAQQLNSATTVHNKEPDNINGTTISISDLQTLAEGQKGAAPSLGSLKFQAAAPQGGEDASRLWVFYNIYNQVEWKYDAASGAYLRSQDKADNSGKFYPTTDKLTGEQLAYENVVVLFADHTFKAPTLIDIDLVGVKNRKAVLFRDGKAYQARWSTLAPLGPIQLVDLSGNPLAYKPGQTWFEVMSQVSYAKALKPGEWKARFYKP